MEPRNYYSCSSWNYGAYAPCNPYFVQQYKTQGIPSQNRYIPHPNNNLYNKYGKRILPEEERIVTNDYMQSLNHMKKMEKSKNSFRIKSSQGRASKSAIDENAKENNNNEQNANNEAKENNNTDNDNNNNEISKINPNKYKFRLTYEEWLEVKNKQQMIFNQIKKIKEEEDQKMEKVNMKVDKKYQEIKDKKYKEWLDNKNREIRMKKQLKLQEELIKEEIKKEKDAEREEKMNEWFKQQAKKMEREILEQQTELRKKKEMEKINEEKKKQKKKESKMAFKMWKERKDEELKEMKQKQYQDKMLKELESKSKHSAFNPNKGFTIGPYTDAGALKEIQRFVNEKCTKEEDDEEEGIVNEEGEEGMVGDEEMTPEQLEELQKLQQIQMNQYQGNVDKDRNQGNVNYAGFNNQELEENNYENYYQQQVDKEENNSN